MDTQLKDVRLNWFAEQRCNIAQFVSYGPDGRQRYCRIHKKAPNESIAMIREAIVAIFATQQSPSINIRTFLPDKPDGNPFVYGITDREVAEAKARELNSQGLYLIVHETIDVRDGGFSGVVFGDTMEVSPFDTPRCVDKAGTMALPRTIGMRLIKTVYRHDLSLPFTKNERVEFSIHPSRLGYLRQHQIIWQADTYKEGIPRAPQIRWPHNYSRAMGDKAFGLLMAHLLGFRVPYTVVIGRDIPYFTFGTSTGTQEIWQRTCPMEQVPGKFPTRFGWSDPFKFMQDSDPASQHLASLLIHDSVDAHYAGAAAMGSDEKLIIEGKAGYGDVFMVGASGKEMLPAPVRFAVRAVYKELASVLNDVRFEWVYDGLSVWIVQLHIGKTESRGNIIYEGDSSSWVHVHASAGLENLRGIIASLPQDVGIYLHGNVGITSHFGDLLRKAKIPSQLV